MTLNSDLLDRLGIRVGFGLATGGYGVLQFNPQLNINWTFYKSPNAKSPNAGFGPSGPLRDFLRDNKIGIVYS